MLVLSKVSYLFLACQHGPDRKEDLYLIIKGDQWVFELLAGLQKTIGQVIVITCIFMECIENCINFNAHLQIFKNNPNYPLYFFSIRHGEQFPEDRYLIVRGGYQLIKHAIKFLDS